MEMETRSVTLKNYFFNAVKKVEYDNNSWKERYERDIITIAILKASMKLLKHC